MTSMKMMRGFVAAGLMGVLFSLAGAQVVVQTHSTTTANSTVEGYSDNGRWFLAKLDGEAKLEEGDWGKGNQLRRYAAAHPGSYIVFLVDGSIYRLSDPKQMHEISALYEPLRQLGKQQETLGSVQRPLGVEQKALGDEMRATHDPATQGHIGAAQGSVGRVQGEIGRQQGVIGKQQGLLGSALNEHVQAMIDACLKDKSCPVVEMAKM